MLNKRWMQLSNIKLLQRAWHLVRVESRNDFITDIFTLEGFAATLDKSLQTISLAVRSETYRPRPLLRIDVPKTELSCRPGSIIALEDRVVLYAIVLLIARDLDQKLPKGVYSYRVNRRWGRDGHIFKEADLYDIPYLKRKKIRAEIDPFDAWYALWPQFDKASREAFQTNKHQYLSTSDISAYFENINLDVLRDQLFQLLPNEPKLINFLISFFEQWTVPDIAGRLHKRGIPQGSNISSFFANIFLLPLDAELDAFCRARGSAYFRYMDDVRVFSKSRKDAVQAIFLLERTLRSLQLNPQSAKTVIYDEANREITWALIDERVDLLSKMRDLIIQDIKLGAISSLTKEQYQKKLEEIARRPAKNPKEEKLIGSRKPLSSLSLRAFRLWVHCHMLLGLNDYVPVLLREALRGHDYRLTRQISSSSRRFPRKKTIENTIVSYLRSTNIKFPHQEAELLWGLRYLSRLNRSVYRTALKMVLSDDAHFYVRMQSAFLLHRAPPTPVNRRLIRQSFNREANSRVKVALAALLLTTNSSATVAAVVRELYLHPDPVVRQFGILLRSVRQDFRSASRRIRFVFAKGNEHLVVDHLPLIWAMAHSGNSHIRQLVRAALMSSKNTFPMLEIRPILADLANSI